MMDKLKKSTAALLGYIPLQVNKRIWLVLLIVFATLVFGVTAASAAFSSEGERGASLPLYGGGPPPSQPPDLHQITGCTDAQAPTFSWEPVNNATMYLLKVYSRDPGDPGSEVQIMEIDTDLTSETPTFPFEHGFEYRWMVHATNPAGSGPPSESDKFTFCLVKASWEDDTFDELNQGPLNGQNGWSTTGESPLVEPSEGWGNILRVDRLSRRSMVIKKNVPKQVSGQHVLEFDVMVSDTTKRSLATIALQTSQNAQWNRKFQIHIGRSIRVQFRRSGASYTIIDESIPGHWYHIRCEIDLDRELLLVWVDGILIVNDIPIHRGPIKGLRITGKIGPGEVKFDNLLGIVSSEEWGVEIVELRENTIVNDVVDVRANTTSHTQFIEFYVDNVLQDIDNTPPYVFSWDTRSNPLPQPTHPMDIGYYFVEWKNPADFESARKEVAGYTNLFFASRASYISNLPTQEWLGLFKESMANAASENRTIHLALDKEDVWRAMLDVAKPYWNNVARIEIGDEPSLTLSETEAMIQRLNAILSEMGLAHRPMGFVYRHNEPLPDAIHAPSLDWVGIEAYVDPPGSSDTQSNIAQLELHLQQSMDQVPAGKDIVLVMMAYDRNGKWENIDTLRDLQFPVYMLAYNDPRVISINMFSYSRKGGTRFHPSLTTAHKLMADRIFKFAVPFAGDGRRTLSVRAYDNEGNVISDLVNVVVSNNSIPPTPPEPTWTPTTTPTPTPIGTPTGTSPAPNTPTPTSTPTLTPTLPSPIPTESTPSETPTSTEEYPQPTPPQPGFWEIDDFKLPLGPLDGQNGWLASRDSAEVVRLYGYGKVLVIDPGNRKVIEMHKSVPVQSTGIVHLDFDVIIADALDSSMAKLVLETYPNSGWDRKFQIFFGTSIRVNNFPTDGAITIVEDVADRKKMHIKLEMNLDSETMWIWVNGKQAATHQPMHPGPITGLSLSGWDLNGSVYLDNIIGIN
jgi:hypothetical protein